MVAELQEGKSLTLILATTEADFASVKTLLR